MKTTCAAGLTSVLFASLAMAQTPICAPSDGISIKTWMSTCDSVASSTAAKCVDEGCHTALHRLEEEETAECWVYLGLGSRADFAKYKVIDTFCHGEGPDLRVTQPPVTAAPTIQPPPASPSTPGTPSTPSAPPTRSITPPPSTFLPSGSVPSVTPKPQC